MERFTAAHRRWAFGTWVRVYNLDNGSETEVRITDRGPFVHGRIIDLSKAAARSVNMLGPGTAKVKLVVIRGPSDPSKAAAAAPPPVPPVRVPSPVPTTPNGRPSPVGPPVSSVPPVNFTDAWAVQVASFSSKERADELRAILAMTYPDVRVDQSRSYWRVLVVTTGAAEARSLLESLRPQFQDAFVLALKNNRTTD
jgi:rare lipoprotein A